jgi:hypothetical protein
MLERSIVERETSVSMQTWLGDLHRRVLREHCELRELVARIRRESSPSPNPRCWLHRLRDLSGNFYRRLRSHIEFEDRLAAILYDEREKDSRGVSAINHARQLVLLERLAQVGADDETSAPELASQLELLAEAIVEDMREEERDLGLMIGAPD